MKTWKKLLIGIIGTVAVILFFIIVPVVILDQSWLWFLVPFIIIIIAWVIVGLILLVINLKKKPPAKLKIDISGAVKRAVYDMKYDTENPDNFHIEKIKLARVGEKDTEPTPVLELDGRGTEKNQKRTIIINMNNPKEETTKLIGASDDEIRRAIMEIAEHPPEEIIEKTTVTTDPLGRATTIREISKPSRAELEKEKEQQKVEETSAM